MKHRCDCLDNLYAFNYNQGKGREFGLPERTDTRHLGSTLMSAMLQEVKNFCDPNIRENWSFRTHQQVRN